MPETIHGTCIAIDRRGILLLGASGSGKSDLALRLIDRGAQLVADDQIAIAVQNKKLMASSPANIAGLLEVRGVGLQTFPPLPFVSLVLAVQLVTPDEVDRLPEPKFWQWKDIVIPMIKLSAFEISAPFKIEIAFRNVAFKTESKEIL